MRKTIVRLRDRVFGATGTRTPSCARRVVGVCLTLALFGAWLTGCGPDLTFPNSLILDDGSEIHYSLLENIVNDPDLSEAEKRRILDEEFGIEDEDIQDFILNDMFSLS